MHGIIRIDREASRKHLWQVSIQRRNCTYTQNFPDQRHGGRQQALAAAQVYRDALLARHPPMTRQECCAIRKKNNRSGVSGVTRVGITDRRRTHPVRAAYWVVRWPVDGKTVKQRMFSIRKHGERGAYLKALAARRAGLRTLSAQYSLPGLPAIVCNLKCGTVCSTARERSRTRTPRSVRTLPSSKL